VRVCQIPSVYLSYNFQGGGGESPLRGSNSESLCSYGSSQVRQDVPEIMNCREHLAFVSNFPSICYFCDSLCGLVVRVLSYRTEMYCVSCEVRNELIYVM
jgi:hypothetical protein